MTLRIRLAAASLATLWVGVTFPSEAQETLDIPISAEIIDQTDLVSLAIVRGGSVGQVVQSSDIDCAYFFKDGVFTIREYGEDETGDITAPGSTPNGCQQLGLAELPQVDLSCVSGMRLPVTVFPVYGDSYWFFGREIRFSSESYDLIESSATLTCPNDGNGDNTTQRISIDFGVIVWNENDTPSLPLGTLDVNMPLSIDFE